MNKWLKRGSIALAGVALALGLATAAMAVGDVGFFSPGEEPTGFGRGQQGQERGWLGIVVTDRPDVEGIIVAQVFADSPADEAGLQRGDIITAVDGQELDRPAQLKRILKDKEVGDALTLTVVKGGALEEEGGEAQVAVTLGARPQPLRVEKEPPFPELAGPEFDDFLGSQFSFRAEDDGVVTVNAHAGRVIEVGEEQLVVALNSGEEKTFAISDATRIPFKRGLAEDEPVLVVTVGDSDEARLVLGGPVLRAFAKLLRQGLTGRLLPPLGLHPRHPLRELALP